MTNAAACFVGAASSYLDLDLPWFGLFALREVKNQNTLPHFSADFPGIDVRSYLEDAPEIRLGRFAIAQVAIWNIRGAPTDDGQFVPFHCHLQPFAVHSRHLYFHNVFIVLGDDIGRWRDKSSIGSSSLAVLTVALTLGLILSISILILSNSIHIRFLQKWFKMSGLRFVSVLIPRT